MAEYEVVKLPAARPFLSTCALALAAAFAVPAPPAAAEAFRFGHPQCRNCSAAAAAPDGTMYLTESGLTFDNRGRVHSFTSGGQHLATYTSTDANRFDGVTDIAVLPGGNLLLASTPGPVTLTPAGTVVAQEDEAPGSVASDSSGSAYWTRTRPGGVGSEIRKREPSGEIRTIYDGGSDWLHGLVINPVDGILYVAANRKVLRLESSGAPAGSFPSEAASDVTVDNRGDLYVAQALDGFRGMQKYSRNGTPLGFDATAAKSVAWADGHLLVPDDGPPMTGGALNIDLNDPVVALGVPGSRKTSQIGTFSASGSTLPFGTIQRYEWDLDGDSTYETDTGSSPVARRRFDVAGPHTVGVRVSGSHGRPDTLRASIDVERSQASVTTPGQVLSGQAVTIDASGSALADSAISSVRYDIDGDGTFETDGGTNLRITARYPTRGTFGPGVQVVREGGVVDVARTSITVFPAPPDGPLGISINNGARFTNTPKVSLDLTWPAFISTVLVSNDGGFRPARSFPVAAAVPVTLDSSGPERLPKTVYARFDGVGQTLTDDIILDQTLPVVSSARLEGPAPARAAAASRRRYRVRLSASDRTSGVKAVQFARSKKRPTKPVKYALKIIVRATAAPRYVRAQDWAGNFSAWKKLKSKSRHR